MQQASAEPAREAGFPIARLGEPARNFSGGNQQKLLLARASKAGLSILLADEPTRGIDIHAKAQIYESLRKAASESRAGVVVVSSDLEELEMLCDRAFVLARNTFVAELDQKRGDLTVARILAHAFGVEEAA
jgi:ABC-type sugar transport system ATPase subunit